MKTIKFEDNGQDFLEWDVNEKGIVTDCRPFQKKIWCGCIVFLHTAIPGKHLHYENPRYNVGTGQIKHRVKSVTEKE